MLKNVKTISEKLQTIWRKVYVVGSYNVHAILKKNFWADIDLTTDARPEDIRKVLRVVWDIWSKYWTLIVREWWEIFEITTFRKDIWTHDKRRPKEVYFTDSLVEDAQRRDFTFNAIYYDVLKDEYLDPTWWIEDLKRWIIRFVGDIESRLDEDVLRILRYVRLKNKYHLEDFSPTYKEVVKKRMPEIVNLAKERIKQELDKMLLDKTNIWCLKNLKELGFFRVYLPQIDNLSLTPGWKKMHLEWDVWVHTLMSLEILNHLKCDDVDIYWATLLHDIWKYSTYSFDDYGNVHYFKHEYEWVKMFDAFIRKKLNFPKRSADKIKWIILNHIRIWMADVMRPVKRNRFMMHEYFKDLLILYRVDNIWKEPKDEQWVILLENMFEEFSQKLWQVKFLTGKDIMEKYPNLTWREIWTMLRQENDRILSKL